MENINWGMEQIFAVLFAGFILYILIRYLRHDKRAFSKEKLSKGLYTLGFLALGLIAFVAFGVFVINAA